MLISVTAGLAQRVTWGKREFATAIVKRPVAGSVAVRGVNVAGDDQADRAVHGGPSKAIYAYASEDYVWWKRELDAELGPGHFGDNLTTQGIDLNNARIGERWRVGGTLLEVSEPRIPCFKLGWRMNDNTFPKRFAQALRNGTYFRIIEEGDLAAGDSIALTYRPDDHDITVREVARIMLFAPKERKRLLGAASLSAAWRDWAAEGDDDNA